jgi:adenosine kinase
VYAELVKDYKVQYIAGGAGQNSMRVAQWMLNTPGKTAYFGAVGKDEYAKTMNDQASTDGAFKNL